MVLQGKMLSLNSDMQADTQFIIWQLKIVLLFLVFESPVKMNPL